MHSPHLRSCRCTGAAEAQLFLALATSSAFTLQPHGTRGVKLRLRSAATHRHARSAAMRHSHCNHTTQGASSCVCAVQPPTAMPAVQPCGIGRRVECAQGAVQVAGLGHAPSEQRGGQAHLVALPLVQGPVTMSSMGMHARCTPVQDPVYMDCYGHAYTSVFFSGDASHFKHFASHFGATQRRPAGCR